MPETSAQIPPATSSTVLYTERLWPAVWIWIVVLGISGAGILVFAPINMTSGYIAAIVLFLIQAVMLYTSTPTIEVTPATLRVGRATIERSLLGTVEAFEGAEATAERGVRLNGLTYLCIRGWISSVVKIQILDPQDKTPYWLASTRHPAALVKALS
ncbi:DUF3093 domain-containing protein [Pseudarthrobacter sp. J1738]|uniref:DUF3093 domain-containing protein n=1 Tax=unclassified Pseudarthrobacter TaxID=2647000 RepID=UPI003D2CA1B6